MPTYRIRPTLEVFPADDRTVYLLRDGMTAEYVIEDVDERQLALLGLLERPRKAGELVAAMASRGWDLAHQELHEILADLVAIGAVEDTDADEGEDLLTAEERARYDRQLAYFADMRPHRAALLQRTLRDATVAVVGVGGLGTWAAAGLASAGVGTLVLVDDDTIELGNLNRQVLYRRADVGRRKVDVAAEALVAFNPDLRVRRLPLRVDGPDTAARVAADADFLVETADWPPFELSRWLHSACWPRGIPRIVAAQFPPLVRIGPTYLPGETPCLDCEERAARRQFPLYDRLVAFRAGRPAVAATLGPASGIIGAAIAMDVVHHLTGIAAPATAGAGLLVDLRDWAIERHPVVPDPACRCRRPFDD